MTRSLNERIEAELRVIRAKQRDQDAADQFWRLWDLRWGVRKELLLVGFGIALPAFIFGASKKFLSVEYIWALAASLFLLWTMVGLVPPYFLRQEVTLRPTLVARFMAKHKNFRDAKSFAKKLYSFLATEFKTKSERTGLQTLLAFERMFEFVGRNWWWAFSVVFVACLVLVVLGVAFSQWLVGQLA